MKRGDHVVIMEIRSRYNINEPAYIAKIMDVDAFHCLVEIIECLDGYTPENTSIEIFPRKFVKPLNYLNRLNNN